MNNTYNKFMKEFNDRINTKIPSNSLISEAMNYSLLNGGKRLRPVLYLMIRDMLGELKESDYEFAMSIEMIHTYSLIHDDLPAMDNDDYRRGKESNHIVFGEAMAILAGDALLNYAYENLFKLIKEDPSYIEHAHLLSKFSSHTGMIYGQSLDIIYENKEADITVINDIILNKTSKLLALPLICGFGDEIKETAFKIGEVFQIKDDILDIEGDKEKLGKSIGKDEKSGKNTFVKINGLENSKRYLEKTKQEIKNSLLKYHTYDTYNDFIEVIEFLIDRDY